MCAQAAQSQTLNPFPTTDSLRKFINKWIRNSAVEAFTNLRLNSSLIGMTRFIDSVYGGQVTGFTYSADTIRLALLNGQVLKVALPASAGNSNLGSGFRLLVPGSQGIKTLFAGNTVLIDSTSNSNGLTVKVDTTVIATIYDLSLKANQQALVDSAAALRSAIGSGGGGGGAPGGSNTQIQYNNAGAFAGDAGLTYNATQNKVTTDSLQALMHRGDSLRVGSVQARAPLNWWFFGTSITFGTGLLDTTKRWANMLSTRYGKVEKNRGVPGATLIKNTPLNPFGGTNMIDYMQSNLPTKTSADEKIFFAFGENDVAVNSANYDTTEYKTDYDSVMNLAVARGWNLATDAVIVSNGWVDSNYSVATRQRQQDFVTATQNFAASRGIPFINVWTLSKLQPNAWFYLSQNPLVHPGEGGHSKYAQIVRDALGDQILAGGQRTTISDTTEVQHLKISSGGMADSTTVPLGLSPRGQVVVYPKQALIINDPIRAQDGRINLTGDIFGRNLIAQQGVLGRSTSFSMLPYSSWHAWVNGTSPTLYAFDGNAIAWRSGSFHASDFLWQIQTNSAFQLTMNSTGKLVSTQNDNSGSYFTIANNSAGSAASADIRVGTSEASPTGRLAFFGSGYTPNGAYAPSTVVLEALGAPATGGLTLLASNASGPIKMFTGGFASGNERMRVASDGQLYLYKTLTGTNTMKLLVKHTDSGVYQIDPSSLSLPAALTTNYIGVGASNLLSGSSAYTYDGSSVLQENSAAVTGITSTSSLSSSSGGVLNLYAKDLPTAAGQRLGAINLGSRNGGTANNFGVTFEALSNAAWTDGTAEQAYARLLTNAVGTQNEVQRWTANIRTCIACTTPGSTLTIGAGNSSVNPFGLTDGTRQTTPTNGSFAYQSGILYFTPSGNTYKRPALFNDVTPTAGGLIQGNGTDFTLLALGTANQLLRVNSGATALEYFTPSYVTLTQLNDSLNKSTIIFDNPNLGDTLVVPVNDSTIRIKSLIGGTNTTFAKTDSTITINTSNIFTNNGVLTGNRSLNGAEIYDLSLVSLDTLYIETLGKVLIDGTVKLAQNLEESITVSAASTLSMSSTINYVASGTTATFSLPTVTAGLAGRVYKVKNRGSGNLTIDVTGGGSTIYDTSAVSSIVISAGGYREFICDGTYWDVR